MGKLWMIGLLLFTVIQECKKDTTGPEGGIPSEMVGTWYATAFTFSNPTNPSQTVNLVESGLAFTLTINGDGAFTATFMESGLPPEVDNGIGTVSGNQLTVIDASDTTVFTWFIIGGVLTLTHQGEAFDFNDDGVEDPAVMTIVMTQSPQGLTGNVPAEAVGTWNATSYIYVNDANSSQTVDVVPLGGAFIISIMSNATFVATWTEPGSTSPEVDTGTIAFSGNQFTVTTPGETTVVTWMISGNTLTLMFAETYDFNNDGTMEDAMVTCVMTKQ